MSSKDDSTGNNKKKVPRGYRLKISTHRRIRELQQLTNNSQEAVISSAIRLYLKKLIEKKQNKFKELS